ncbi:MAG: hypothetical protein HQ495_06540 [Alphaproteobacteria bacterium]|nr:hypothetical protein [Alphaproteobacteria bacterium]
MTKIDYSDRAARAYSEREVLLTSFRVLGRNLFGFVFLAGFINVGAILLAMLLGLLPIPDAGPMPAQKMVMIPLYMLSTSLLTAMVSYGTYRDLRGEPARLSELVGQGLRVAVPIILVGLLITIIVLIGSILLIIPGIVLFVMLWVALPAALLSVRAFLRRCAAQGN